jgi:hypothetical protein
MVASDYDSQDRSRLLARVVSAIHFSLDIATAVGLCSSPMEATELPVLFGHSEREKVGLISNGLQQRDSGDENHSIDLAECRTWKSPQISSRSTGRLSAALTSSRVAYIWRARQAAQMGSSNREPVRRGKTHIVQFAMAAALDGNSHRIASGQDTGTSTEGFPPHPDRTPLSTIPQLTVHDAVKALIVLCDSYVNSRFMADSSGIYRRLRATTRYRIDGAC